MKAVAGCCKTDRHQTNEGDSCLGALFEGGFWRFSGEYGCSELPRLKGKAFLLRRKELEKLAVQEKN